MIQGHLEDLDQATTLAKAGTPHSGQVCKLSRTTVICQQPSSMPQETCKSGPRQDGLLVLLGSYKTNESQTQNTQTPKPVVPRPAILKNGGDVVPLDVHQLHQPEVRPQSQTLLCDPGRGGARKDVPKNVPSKVPRRLSAVPILRLTPEAPLCHYPLRGPCSVIFESRSRVASPGAESFGERKNMNCTVSQQWATFGYSGLLFWATWLSRYMLSKNQLSHQSVVP